jgi:parvulin-like peptidyl-prolyl isomerase
MTKQASLRAVAILAAFALASTVTSAQTSSSTSAPAEPPPGVADPHAGVTMPEPVDPATFPAVVATVNGKAIAKDELLKAVKAFATRSGGAMPQLPKAAYAQMLDQLVNLQLLLQDAASKQIAVTDAEVDAEVTGIRQRYPSPAEFAQALGKEGLDEENLRREIRESLTVKKLVEGTIAKEITIDEPTTKAYYDGNPKTFARPEQYHVAHILIKAEKTATPDDKEAARKKATEILAKLTAGGDFAALAKESSEDSGSKDNGGELPWLSPGDTAPDFEKVAMAMEAGKLSGVVESQFGFHIIKGIDHRAAGTVPYDQVKERIGQVLKNQKVQEAVVAYAAKLRTAAKVEVKL